MTGRQERIRARAYEIWEREGRPEGREDEHWRQAAAEVDAEDSDVSGQAIPAGSSGTSSGLQPGGTVPGGGPGASQGSIGTGGASSGPSGTVKRSHRAGPSAK